MKKTVEIRAAQAQAVALLKGELKNRNLTYGLLAHRLKQAGLRYDKVNVANKIRRGTFSAGFFLLCLKVLEVEAVKVK